MSYVYVSSKFKCVSDKYYIKPVLSIALGIEWLTTTCRWMLVCGSSSTQPSLKSERLHKRSQEARLLLLTSLTASPPSPLPPPPPPSPPPPPARTRRRLYLILPATLLSWSYRPHVMGNLREDLKWLCPTIPLALKDSFIFPPQHLNTPPAVHLLSARPDHP